MTAVITKPDVRPGAVPGQMAPARPARRHGLAKLGRPSIYLAVIIWMIATLGPYIIMLLTSLIPQSQLVAPGGSLLPTHPTLAAYSERTAFDALRKRAMRHDVTWERSARRYEHLFKQLAQTAAAPAA